MGRRRKIPTLRALKTALTNTELRPHVSGRTNGFGLFTRCRARGRTPTRSATPASRLSRKATFSAEIARVRYSAEQGALGAEARLALSSVASQNP